MRNNVLAILSLFLATVVVASNNRSKIASIPFEVVGTYVVVKVQINESTPLNFILDSGLGSTIVTELTTEDSLSLKSYKKTKLNGLGSGKEIFALVSQGNSLQTGRMKFVNQTVNLLEQDIFNLSAYTGRKINGLLGSDFFQDHVVKVDYSTQRITFYESSTFEIPRGYVAIPLTFKDDKMYAKILVADRSGKPREVSMLIDSGAELAAWFRSFGNDAIKVPEKRLHGYIGQGLNGDIEGYIGKLPRIYFGGHVLHNPIVSFPDSITISDAIKDINRNGTIGSQILSRFNLIFDEPNEMLYIKPNSNFRKDFVYNVAGVETVKQANFPFLPEVFYVWSDSPADLAGVKPGDLILDINGQSGFKTDINEIRKIFEGHGKNKLTLSVLRNGINFTLNVDISGRL
jgi:hypothetical protein